MVDEPGNVLWEGVIRAVQPRAWVWRYKLDNRTHNLKKWILNQLAEEAAIYPKDVVAALSGRRTRSSITRGLAAPRADGVIGKGRKALIIAGASQ